METAEQILMGELNNGQKAYLKSIPDFKDFVLDAMEVYAEQQSGLVQELFTEPAKKLKPLEDLWRKENYPNGEYVIPDTTKFYEWITAKILNT